MSDDDGVDARRAAEHRISRMERAEWVAEIGSWEWFPASGDMTWSENLYRLHGLRPGEVTPKAEYVLGVTHPDDRERMARVQAFLGHE